MHSRETADEIAVRIRATVQKKRMQRNPKAAETESQRQSQSDAPVAESSSVGVVQTPEPISGKEDWSNVLAVESSSVEVAQTLEPISGQEKWSIGSVWSHFKIDKLQLPFSFNWGEPSITSSGVPYVFSYEELKIATDNFKRPIGDGGYSTVYRGQLLDGRMVAVKVLSEGPKWVKEFTKEVDVLSKLHHSNLVSLYGYTAPGSQKLLLVYEFVPNGTINDHLQGKLSSLPWTARIQIAIETARALTYLHSLEESVIHRDVKTSNILLDDEFHAKVADFGMCYVLPSDKTSVTTKPEGTVGYLDPDYNKSQKLTAKSDVYSFGVVLFELISRLPAVDVNRGKSGVYLYKLAINKIRHNKREELIDRSIGYHKECENYNSENRRMIDLVAELACHCLQPQANRRPSIKEVLSSLTGIQDRTEPINCEPSSIGLSSDDEME